MELSSIIAFWQDLNSFSGGAAVGLVLGCVAAWLVLAAIKWVALHFRAVVGMAALVGAVAVLMGVIL